MRPSLLLCEFEDRKSEPLGYRVADLAELLTARGYAVLISEWYPIVEYGRAHHWRRVERWPSALGPDAWGNLIALDPALAPRALRLARRYGWQYRLRRLVEQVLRRDSKA